MGIEKEVSDHEELYWYSYAVLTICSFNYPVTAAIFWKCGIPLVSRFV